MLTLAQEGPPTQPIPLSTEIQGLLNNWLSMALAFVAVGCVVFMAWAFMEISRAKQMGEDPHHHADRILVIAAVLMVASSIGGVVSLIYVPTPFQGAG